MDTCNFQSPVQLCWTVWPEMTSERFGNVSMFVRVDVYVCVG